MTQPRPPAPCGERGSNRPGTAACHERERGRDPGAPAAPASPSARLAPSLSLASLAPSLSLASLAPSLSLAALSGLLGCATGPEPAPPPGPPPEPRARLELDAGPSGQLLAPGPGLALRVPDRAGWLSGSRSRWFVASHGPSRSRIRLRAYRLRRGASIDECHDQLRLWAPELPGGVPEQRIEARRLRVPPPFEGRLEVGVRPTASPDGGAPIIEGFAVLVAAGLERCVAAVATTRAAGPQVMRVMGHRLQVLKQALMSLRRVDVEAARGRPRRKPFE